MENILILHGWGSSAKNWSRVKELLENDGHKVFVPDLPGFGENTPPEKPWSVDDYVDWVKDFCGKNNLSQFFLVGHSFGGGIAVKFTAAFPEKLSKLILIAPAIVRRKTFEQNIFLGLAKIGHLIFSVPGLSHLRPLAREFLYNFTGSRDYYKLEVAKSIAMKETFKRVVGEDLTHYLPKIKIHTLIIWGARDALTPIEEAYLIKNRLKNSNLEIISDGRHGLNLENPEILAQKILNFIKP